VSICEEAARQSAYDRHMDQALEQSRERLPGKLTVLRGEGDDLTAPSPSHPASRALRRQEDS
jgi:hypothetical protein